MHHTAGMRRTVTIKKGWTITAMTQYHSYTHNLRFMYKYMNYIYA